MLATALRSLNLAAAACAALAAGTVLWLTMQGEAVTVLGWSNGLAAPTMQAVTEPQAQPVAPHTDMERFAIDLATALGNAQPSPALVAFLVAWHQAEGGSAAFNPFNTTQAMDGATIYNSVGVKNYASYQDGLQATVTTLGYGYNGYADIREGIRTNDPARSLRGLYASPWGTSAALVEQVWHEQLGTIRNSQGIPNPDIHGAPLHGPLVITQGYGVGTHAPADIWGGVDYAAQTGDPLYAIIDGTAEVVSQPKLCGLGLKVKGPMYQTLYCHMSRVDVQSGQQITAGQAVGAAGASGEASGPHVHVEVRENGRIIDPTAMIQEVR